MGLVAWQAMVQVRGAVDALVLSVEKNNAVLMKFMTTVETDHRSQNEALNKIQTQIRSKQATGTGSKPDNIGGNW
jgi:hypothetical protein